MRKITVSILVGSLLFSTATLVFASESDKATDIRKQILELTKELAEASKTEGNITYKVLEPSQASNIIACEITNNTEYTQELHPSFVARDDDGNLKFAYIINNLIIGAGDTYVVYQDMRNSEFMDRVRNSTIEWGAWAEYSDRATCTEYVDIDVTQSGKKLILTPSINNESDGKHQLKVAVVFMKDNQVIYVAEDSIFKIDPSEQIEITYAGSGPYDDYTIYYTAYTR